MTKMAHYAKTVQTSFMLITTALWVRFWYEVGIGYLYNQPSNITLEQWISTELLSETTSSAMCFLGSPECPMCSIGLSALAGQSSYSHTRWPLKSQFSSRFPSSCFLPGLALGHSKGRSGSPRYAAVFYLWHCLELLAQNECQPVLLLL